MGYGRAMLWGAVAGLLVIVLGVAGVVFLAPSLRSTMNVPGDRVLLVAASKDGTATGQVAQLIGVAELGGGGLEVRLVDPLTTVTVPGTTYDKLRDAYPFGGGAGVAKAYASAQGEQPLPVISLSEAGLVDLVDRVGGLELTVPAGLDVFDGTNLYTFPAGPQKLDGAKVAALLSAVDYLATSEQRTALRAAVAGALAEALADSSADLSDLGGRGYMASSLQPGDLRDVGMRLRRALGTAAIRPSDR